MSPQKKIIYSILWAVTVVMMVAVVAGQMSRAKRDRAEEQLIANVRVEQPTGLPAMWDAPPFALTDQNGKSVTDQDLRGHPWIADFVFTHSAGPCPEMSAKMAKLQEQIPQHEVRLISFSVDPERDTPAVLKEYSKQFDADESRWSFLTGDMKDVYAVAAGMRLTAIAATADAPVIHDERFVLIDAEGKVRGVYYSKDAEKMQKLLTDVASLFAGGGKTP